MGSLHGFHKKKIKKSYLISDNWDYNDSLLSSDPSRSWSILQIPTDTNFVWDSSVWENSRKMSQIQSQLWEATRLKRTQPTIL